MPDRRERFQLANLADQDAQTVFSSSMSAATTRRVSAAVIFGDTINAKTTEAGLVLINGEGSSTNNILIFGNMTGTTIETVFTWRYIHCTFILFVSACIVMQSVVLRPISMFWHQTRHILRRKVVDA
jgi:hypothetical protein